MDATMILTAISSIATLTMSIFYFISISLQLYQMRLLYLPALGFDQIFLTVHKNGEFQISNSSNPPATTKTSGEYFMKLFNLGGGGARNISIRVYMNKDEQIEQKYVNLLPAKESYQLPISREIYNELKQAIQRDEYESKLRIVMDYRQALSHKTKTITYDILIDNFNNIEDREVYEVQFVSKMDKKFLDI